MDPGRFEGTFRRRPAGWVVAVLMLVTVPLLFDWGSRRVPMPVPEKVDVGPPPEGDPPPCAEDFSWDDCKQELPSIYEHFPSEWTLSYRLVALYLYDPVQYRALGEGTDPGEPEPAVKDAFYLGQPTPQMSLEDWHWLSSLDAALTEALGDRPDLGHPELSERIKQLKEETGGDMDGSTTGRISILKRYHRILAPEVRAARDRLRAPWESTRAAWEAKRNIAMARAELEAQQRAFDLYQQEILGARTRLGSWLLLALAVLAWSFRRTRIEVHSHGIELDGRALEAVDVARVDLDDGRIVVWLRDGTVRRTPLLWDPDAAMDALRPWIPRMLRSAEQAKQEDAARARVREALSEVRSGPDGRPG